MKFTLSWLKEHLETEASPAAIAERLTMIGLEVEAVHDRGRDLADFFVAAVLSAEPHPNADKLTVCSVDTGAERLQVVCGAPNARAGMKGIFAPVGVSVPGTGLVLKRAAIRGVESAGMLLSAREMNLSDDHTGIVEVAPEFAVGTPAAVALGLADPLFDVAITPNRGDCLGVRGIGRDLAAAGLGRLKALTVEPVAAVFVSPIKVRLELDGEAANACPFFVGRTIRGVSNAESPRWLKERLSAIGLRPISALVDITNYLMYDLNRPLHVFDADRVRGDLHVRLSREGEVLTALNGQTYTLDAAMTVITDDVEVESLGGVMGGMRTGCTGETTAVFLESALFDPIRTARTGRSLGILSDARFRFERGIDSSFVSDGLEIATRLILDLCGGEPSSLVIAGAAPPPRAAIRFRPSRVQALTGIAITPAESVAILETLGFTVEGGNGDGSVIPPPWRGDVDSEACLIEEVARLRGFEHIPATPLAAPTVVPAPALSPEQQRRATARRVLAARGLTEAVTFSFLSKAEAEPFGGANPALRLINPISADLDQMRPSLVPNLLSAVHRNGDRGMRDCALFEVGPQYRGIEPHDQEIAAAGVRSGRAGPRHWALAARPVDVFDVKADVLGVLESLGVAVERVKLTADAPAWYHPGRSGTLRFGPKNVLAAFGELHPAVLAQFDVQGSVAAFEVFLGAVPGQRSHRGESRPIALSPLQPIERDFAFIVDAEVAAEAVLAAVRRAEAALISDLRVFDVFAGGGIGEGRKSIAITVVLQPMEMTLTDAEIEAIAERIVASVTKATGGVLRS
ncbi:MAG: phenylalanine--tRNA ligase subunit beta [Defluviicoccus sp.]